LFPWLDIHRCPAMRPGRSLARIQTIIFNGSAQHGQRDNLRSNVIKYAISVIVAGKSNGPIGTVTALQAPVQVRQPYGSQEYRA
jgi:hypothetical protein